MRFILLFLATVAIASCSTSQHTTTIAARDSIAQVEPRIIFGFTSSGFGNRPSDAIRLDSSGQMTFITRSRVTGDEFKAVTGMAFVEDDDYAQLRSIVNRGNLTAIDSTDLGVKCPQGQGELMSLVLRRTSESEATNLYFDECGATEYNLLLEPQRSAFKELINWLAFARGKYRPAKP